MAGQKCALLSVTDKAGIIEFGRQLVGLGYTLLSTGGTAKVLREGGLRVVDVAEYTESAEILDGRVKSLHPKVHGGILYDRQNAAHAAAAVRAGLAAIDVVVVNLYQFREEAVAKGLSAAAAIEHIDVGGPAMLRAAAKNHASVWPVVDPADYPKVIAGVGAGASTVEAAKSRRALAAKAFGVVSAYDAMISDYLAKSLAGDTPATATPGKSTAEAPALAPLPQTAKLELSRVSDLRYGENPHQRAGLYRIDGVTPFAFGALEFLQGKELSYNNILDLDAATGLVREFDAPAVVVVKHTNACGCAGSASEASAAPLAELVRRALAGDPKSAFGGIFAVNRRLDGASAEVIASIFVECVAAPDFSPEALAIFARKPAVRLVRAPFCVKSPAPAPALQFRSVRGGLLLQDDDQALAPAAAWTTVTKRKPTTAEQADLAFAWAIVKHVKSNAIVFAKDLTLSGAGAGQMSRIDSVRLGADKAREHGHPVRGAVMASDAFFPFRDTVDQAAALGVAAIIQPGGSKKDQESIAAADAHGIAMVFTGERHFRH